MRGFIAGAAIGIILGWFIALSIVVYSVAWGTPFPSPSAQLDIDGNCAVNFPGDSIMHAKIALGVLPVPTGFPTCRDWYATPTATPTP